MIYFAVPFLNEYSNLSSLVDNLSSLDVNDKIHYVFVDDGSSDGSSDLLKEILANTAHSILINDTNKGPGFSFNRAFKYILSELNAKEDDQVVTIEADNTSDLGILKIMLYLSNNGFDLVLASPYAQGGLITNTNIFRKVLSFLANTGLRTWFNVRVLTISSFYRVYKVDLLKKIDSKYDEIIYDAGFISQLEVLIKSIKVGSRIVEVPMILNSEKRKGKSKMKVWRTTFSYIKFVFNSHKHNLKEK